MANTKITTNVIADGAITSAKLDTNITISGNITGTLATAAQPNITSLGTLTALTGGTGDLNWDSGTLFVDSSANAVGIGTTSPSYPLEVQSGGVGTVLRAGTSFVSIDSTGSASAPSLIFNGDANTGIWRPASDTLAVSTAGGEVARFDSSGNVGINATSIAANGLQIGNTSSTDTEQLYLYSNKATFALEVDGANNAAGTIMTYSWANGGQGSLRFKNASGEVARFDSSGNLLVGNTVVNPVSGFASQKGFGYAASTGKVEIATDANAAVMELGKNNANDGSILVFRKQSNVVGTINNSGTNLGIEGQSGIVFLGGDRTGSVRAINSHGSGQPRLDANNDNTTDLGTGANRFKDLYLSGGVYLGGTGAANHLDDYEEGTWTPVLTVGGGSFTYSYRAATYRKVGNMVNIIGGFGLSGISSPTGNLGISGLPFTNGSGEGYVASVSFSVLRNFSQAFDQFRGYVDNGGTSITLAVNNENTGHSYPSANTLTATTQIYFSVTYNVA